MQEELDNVVCEFNKKVSFLRTPNKCLIFKDILGGISIIFKIASLRYNSQLNLNWKIVRKYWTLFWDVEFSELKNFNTC